MAKKQILLDNDTKDRIIEKSKLTLEECFVLDAYIVSNLTTTDKKHLVYRMSRKREATNKKDSLDQLVYRFFKRKAVEYYIEDREIELFGARRERDEQGNIKEDGNVVRNKEETIKELNELASATTEAKLKAEILMRIADLQQWKKQDNEEGESQIKVYRQLKCSECKLYLSAKTSLNESNKDN